MKKFILFAVAAMLCGSVMAAQKSIEERVNSELGVFKEVLKLTDEQAAVVGEGITKKITIGKEAYLLKKDGNVEEAQAMNKAAGKEFFGVLKATLTKEQMAVYQENKDVIKEKLEAARQ